MTINYQSGIKNAVSICMLTLFLAACTGGSMLSSEKANFEEQATTDAATDQPLTRLRKAKLNVPCPAAVVRADTQAYVVYGKGKDVPENVRYQGTIRDLASNCALSDTGAVVVRVGIVGRVVAGPKGGAGEVSLPIRIAFLRDGELLYSELHRPQVSLTSTQLTQAFILLVEDIPHANPSAGAGQIYVGFDSRR